VTILSAIMSTADGLVVSTSQVFANDIYRKSLAPRLHPNASEKEIDHKVLVLSRWGTAVVLLGSAVMAWHLQEMNVALLIWAGLGGMISALAGPLVFGAMWQGATRAGALAGLIGGPMIFILAHMNLIAGSAQLLGLESTSSWLAMQAPNPYSCATLGCIVSVLLTYFVSKVTKPLPETHLMSMFERSETLTKRTA